uniref:Uncharacterized protein n=1 Tax=Utricularia reniformis TaxID=192314 RepID=A0A1Y0B0P6_9LAMI|nr:hypothetical protein AEK19_MT0729 [Utricularia reniformis]ART30973.1 hypothetical protein AEK19_MT0729 [Utricularia reniformis]
MLYISSRVAKSFSNISAIRFSVLHGAVYRLNSK